MAIHKSGIAKTAATAIRVIQFLGAIVLLAVWSTYLARQSTRHEGTTRNTRAVEGISGAAVLYTAFAVLLTCCLGGKRIFAFLAMAVDVCFMGCMVAIAVITRAGGTSKCYFAPDSTLRITYQNRIIELTPKQQRTDCHLVKAVFAVSILMAFFFIISAFLQLSVEKADHSAPVTHHTNPRKSRNPFNRSKKPVAYDAEMATRH